MGVPASLHWVDRQRVMLLVHLRLNPVTLLDVSSLLGGVVGMHPYFLPVLPLDEIGIVFDAQHVALEGLHPFERPPFISSRICFSPTS